ncbi:MAG TPA: hypothetical protein VG826_05685 [Pirellulales bacterium]|nr:hypothetical protein [Pirellulales bacterium]
MSRGIRGDTAAWLLVIGVARAQAGTTRTEDAPSEPLPSPATSERSFLREASRVCAETLDAPAALSAAESQHAIDLPATARLFLLPNPAAADARDESQSKKRLANPPS